MWMFKCEVNAIHYSTVENWYPTFKPSLSCLFFFRILQKRVVLRVRHDWVTSLSRFFFLHWRRKWQPTPVLLLGKSYGWRSLEGCSPLGRWGLDTTEWLHFHFSLSCIGRRKWQPTPVFLPGESQGRGSLVGCRLWGRTESDTTEVT